MDHPTATRLILVAIFTVGVTCDLFRFGPLYANNVLLVFSVVAMVVIVLAGLKHFRRGQILQ